MFEIKSVTFYLDQHDLSHSSFIKDQISGRRYHDQLAHAIYKDFFSKKKNENFIRKKNDIFLIFAQNIVCGRTLEPPRRGGSNEYPQSMFWSKNKKNRYTPAYPNFAI